MLRQYLLLSIKVLLRRKFFTFISIFGIAFTLLVLTVITAIADKGLAAERPESRQSRTLGVSTVTMFGPHSTMNASGGYKLYDRYARNLPGAEALSIYMHPATVHAFLDGRKEAFALKRTDADFWRILDFTFVDGRPYTDNEVREAAFVAVVTRSAAGRLLLGQSPVGSTIEVDGQRFHVIGVVDDVSELRAVPFADIWVPISTSKSPGYRDEMMSDVDAIVLASTSAAMKQIHDEFNSRLRGAELPDPRSFTTIVAPMETKLEGVARMAPFANRMSPQSQLPTLVGIALVAGLLFVLLPAVNLVNINLSRILERSSEIGVRKAFGASSRTLVFQFVVENIVLTLCGALVAFVLSTAMLGAINRSGIVEHAGLGLNLRVFAWGVVTAVLFGVMSGVYPAWRMSRLRPAEALRGSAR